MSLLMDALKKAEMAKRQGTAGAPRESSLALTGAASAGAPGTSSLPQPSPPAQATQATQSAPLPQLTPLTLEPLPGMVPVKPGTVPEPLPATPTVAATAATATESASAPERVVAPPRSPLELKSDALQEASSFMGAPVKAPAPPGAGAASPPLSLDQRHVQNVFQAKQADAAGSGKSRAAFAWAMGGLTALAVLVIGVYFWWQLQPRNTLVASGSVSRPASQPASPSPVPAVTVVPPVQSATSVTNESAAPAATAAAAPKQVSGAPTAASYSAAGQNGDESPIRVVRAPQRVNPQLSSAFESVRAGDWEAARTAYGNVLASDPYNSDALHGLAAIATRDGRPADADRYLQRLLAANPQDAEAAAALASLHARTHPELAETRLKSLTSAQPELSSAQIALGNLYAGQERWAEAQQAYFAAYASQPDNPDLLFNLAVSLEHLNQPRLALQYYREARQAGARWPANFTAAQVDERMRALQP